MSQFPQRRHWQYIVRAPEPMPLPEDTLDILALLVSGRLMQWPFGDDRYAEPLSKTPQLREHEAYIRTRLKNYVRVMAEQMLGLRGMADPLAARLEGELHRTLQDYGPALCNGASRADLRGATQYHLLRALYPPYTLPLSVKNQMLDEACQQMLTTSRHNDAPLQDSALMHDERFTSLLDDVINELAALHFSACQDRQKTRFPPILRGTLTDGHKTYAQEREFHHRRRKSLRHDPRLVLPPHPADIYDLFAFLEERLGTAQAKSLGSQICTSFLQQLEVATVRYEQAHHLDVPFHHRGNAPQLG